MKLTDILHSFDENLKVDFNNRLSILWHDGQFQKESIVQKTEESEYLVQRLSEKLSQYRFSYYIEYSNVSLCEFTSLDLPDYVLKQDGIKFGIEYVDINGYFGYYQLTITDGGGHDVPSSSDFFKLQNSRDSEYDREFGCLQRQFERHIDEIQSAYNECINKFKDEKEE